MSRFRRIALLALLGLVLAASPVLAQDEALDPTQPLGDTATTTEDSLLAELAQRDPRIAAMAAEGRLTLGMDSSPLLRSFDNKPKAGVKASVQSYLYYGELETILAMRGGSQFQNKFAFSWNDYRSYDKVIESRSNRLNYLTGALLPFSMDVVADWDWSEDRTVNTENVTNLIKRDNRNGAVTVRKLDLRTGALVHDLDASVGVVDENSENRSTAGARNEAKARFHLQTGWEIDPGLVIAGRLHGQGAQGDLLLRHQEDSAKSIGDSLGAGAYYDRGWLVGRAVLTQSTFDSEFLDWRRNDRGSPDTTGVVPPEDQIVRERKVAKKQAIVLENEVVFGRVGLALDIARTVNETAYAKSGQGTIENFEEKVDFEITAGAGRDSFVAAYGYRWVWDDQYLQNGTRRGRQNKRGLDAGLKWYRPFFSRTRLSVILDQSLDQQIPDDRPNGNNKDLLRTGASASLRRSWGDSDVDLAMRWSQIQDISIGSDQSIQNQTKDRYTIAPAFNWQMNHWLRFSQEYALYIEYRNYDYPDERRTNSYDKRGRLTSYLVLNPTPRLRLSVEHKYNRTFKANQSGTTAGGSDVYTRTSEQTYSNLNFGFTFSPISAVTLEARTNRGRDTQYSPVSGSESTKYEGKILTGVRVKQKWGSRNPVELSARVEKINAFGRGITPQSSDYWILDCWLKWSF